MTKEPCCPKCKGTSGYSFEMTETHQMGGPWGFDAEAGDSGYYVKQSLVKCDDCGIKFQWEALKRKGMVNGLHGRR